MTVPTPDPNAPLPEPRSPWGCAGWAWIVILIAIVVIIWLIVTRWGYQGIRRNAPPPGITALVHG